MESHFAYSFFQLKYVSDILFCLKLALFRINNIVRSNDNIFLWVDSFDKLNTLKVIHLSLT